MKLKAFLIITTTLLSLILSSIAFGYPNCIYVSLVPSTIQFQLIDPLGNKTGYDPIINSVIENIPNTMYSKQQLTTISDKPLGDAYHKLEPIHTAATYSLVAGKYQLKIFGANVIDKYSYDITIYYEQATNDIRYSQRNKTLIYPNVTWTYKFDVPAVPPANGQLTLVKVSTPQNLITDINAAASLNYIGNKQFVSEIIKKAEAVSLSKADQKKEYTELLNEITEKYNKPVADEFVKQEAYTVLKEDLEYIISHL